MGPGHRVTLYIGGISWLPVAEMCWGKKSKKKPGVLNLTPKPVAMVMVPQLISASPPPHPPPTNRTQSAVNGRKSEV